MSRNARGSGPNPSVSQQGAKPVGSEAPGERLDSFDIADELKGDNSLQGEDQERHSSERHAQAGATGEVETDLLENFKKIDKDYRAEAARQEKGKQD